MSEKKLFWGYQVGCWLCYQNSRSQGCFIWPVVSKLLAVVWMWVTGFSLSCSLSAFIKTQDLTCSLGSPLPHLAFFCHQHALFNRHKTSSGPDTIPAWLNVHIHVSFMNVAWVRGNTERNKWLQWSLCNEWLALIRKDTCFCQSCLPSSAYQWLECSCASIFMDITKLQRQLQYNYNLVYIQITRNSVTKNNIWNATDQLHFLCLSRRKIIRTYVWEVSFI